MKRWSSPSLCAALSGLFTALAGCTDTTDAPPPSAAEFSGVVGAAGGSLTGDGAFAGVVVSAPPGAFSGDTTITVTSVAPPESLPETAASVGPMFEVTFSASPSKRVTVTLPVDQRTASAFGQDYRQVKVWYTASASAVDWSRLDAGSTDALDGLVGAVTVGLDDGGVLGAGVVLGDEPCDGDCPPLDVSVLPLAQPAFGTALASTGTTVLTLRVTDEGGATALQVVRSPADGGLETTSDSLVIDAAADAWPARGLAEADGVTVVGLRTGLASFPDGAAPSLDEGETLTVVDAGDHVAWVVPSVVDGERLPAVRLVTDGVAADAVPLVSTGSSKSLATTATSLTAAAGEGGFVLGLPDRLVVVSVEGGTVAVSDVIPLGGDAIIDAVSSNRLLRDRDGYLRNEKGLVVEDVPPLGALAGSGDHVFGTSAGGRVVVRLTSDGVASNPFEPAPFRLAETEKGTLTGRPWVALVEVVGGVVGLDSAGELRRVTWR